MNWSKKKMAKEIVITKQVQEPSEGEKKLQAQIEQLQATAKESKDAMEALQVETEKKEKLEKETKLQSDADIKKLFTVAKEEPKKESGIDDLSPSQLLDVVADGFEKVMVANAEQMKLNIEAATKTADDKLNGITSVLQGVVAKLSIDATKSAHSDFEDMRPGMIEVNKKYPGMDAEDMYLLAKSKIAGTAPPKKKVESERPGSHLTAAGEMEGLDDALNARDNSSMNPQGQARSKDQQGRRQGMQPGIVKYRDFVKAAAEKVVDEMRTSD